MRERLEPGQAKKATRSFDSVDEPKDIAEHLAVIRLALKANKLRVNVIEAFSGLGQKLTQQLIHERLTQAGGRPRLPWVPCVHENPLKERGSLWAKRLISVAE